MTTILAINAVDAVHLHQVIAEMHTLGAPTIRAIRDEAQGVIVALDGSHRLAAAQALGLTPVLDLLDADTLITCAEIGYDDMGWFDGEPARADDIRAHIARPQGSYPGAVFYDFDLDA